MLKTIFLFTVTILVAFSGRALSQPSNIEQLIIYELNRARENPARFDRENNLSGILNGIASQPPLAVNNSLVGSGNFHAEEMAAFNYFAHQSAVTGDWPNKLARDNGYDLPNFYPNDQNNIESIAAGTIINTALSALTLLIVDAGVNPPGHRIHLLATDAFFQTHREIGTGYGLNNSSTFKNYFAIQTAVSSSGGQFLTGVVYNDLNHNGRYDLGEGLGGVTVNNGVTNVQTNSAGGWSIAVSSGSYTVTASGGGFAGTATAHVTVATNNIEVDFASGNSVGEINFARQDGNCALVGADIDGDCKSDIGVYRDGVWTIIRSSDGGNTVVNWGGSVWQPVPGDYDGDGKTDIAVYFPTYGVWSIIRSSDGGNTVVNWGGSLWQPVPGDYDGDGKTDIAVYNSSAGGVWSIIRSSDGGNTVVNWGGSLWQPVPADYDGDGKTDIAVYNSSAGGVWSIIRSSDGGNTVVNWGGAAWQPVPADYDGDDKADIAVYKTNAGVWSIIRSSDSGNTVVNWGGPSWEPVPADYDGDGKADIGVYYRPYGVWSIIRSSDGGNTVVGWGGQAQDVPLTKK
jgi:hypothetical protein